MSDNHVAAQAQNISPFPVPPLPPPPQVSPMQKLGNAVNMFGMAVANEDEKVMTATKKHLLEIVHAIHPNHEPSLIQTPEGK